MEAARVPETCINIYQNTRRRQTGWSRNNAPNSYVRRTFPQSLYKRQDSTSNRPRPLPSDVMKSRHCRRRKITHNRNMRRRVPLCIYLLKELLMTEIIRKGWCPKCNYRAGKVDVSIIIHDHGVGFITYNRNMRRSLPLCFYLLKEWLMTEMLGKGWCPSATTERVKCTCL
jgi:hypothetical protein